MTSKDNLQVVNDQLRAALQRIVDNKDNKNWRKPEIVAEAERALARCPS
jgi:hypothetical protein